jgi:hypothetical protein
MNRLKLKKDKAMIMSVVLVLGVLQVSFQPAQAIGRNSQDSTSTQTIEPGSRLKGKGKLEKSRWEAAKRHHELRAEAFRNHLGQGAK